MVVARSNCSRIAVIITALSKLSVVGVRVCGVVVMLYVVQCCFDEDFLFVVSQRFVVNLAASIVLGPQLVKPYRLTVHCGW